MCIGLGNSAHVTIAPPPHPRVAFLIFQPLPREISPPTADRHGTGYPHGTDLEIRFLSSFHKSPWNRETVFFSLPSQQSAAPRLVLDLFWRLNPFSLSFGTWAVAPLQCCYLIEFFLREVATIGDQHGRKWRRPDLRLPNKFCMHEPLANKRNIKAFGCTPQLLNGERPEPHPAQLLRQTNAFRGDISELLLSEAEQRNEKKNECKFYS